MSRYQFTLVLDDATIADADLADRLYAATEDIDLAVRAGTPHLLCSRDAETMDQAIAATLREIRDLGLVVASVEPYDRETSIDGIKGGDRDARAIAAVNAALELARWHGRPDSALQFLRPMAM